MPEQVTPWRIVSLLVLPAATGAVLCAWSALDSAAYAYRLWRTLRSS